MRNLFQKRRQVFRNQCLKYSRYVFNDHFVLFLLVFIGFLAVQYSQLLRNFPKNHLPIILALAVLLVFLLPLGRIATYMEKPDSLFLLVKEEELKSYLQKQTRLSYRLWALLQTVVLLLLVPLFLALGMPLWGWFILVFLMLIAKWFVFLQKSHGASLSLLLAFLLQRRIALGVVELTICLILVTILWVTVLTDL